MRQACPGTATQGESGHGKACRGRHVKDGVASRGWACSGMAGWVRHVAVGLARPGSARQGMANIDLPFPIGINLYLTLCRVE